MNARSFSATCLVTAAAIVSLTLPASAVARTLDLVTYTAPEGWTVTDQTGGAGPFVTMSKASTTTYCLVAIYASTPATGDLAESFASEWQGVALQAITDVEAPEPKMTRVGNANAAIGSAISTAKTTGQPAIGKLVVLDAGESVVSIMVMAPSAKLLKAYDADLQALMSSITVKQVSAPAVSVAMPAAPARAVPGAPAIKADSLPIPTNVSALAGEWGITDGINTTYVYRDSGTYAGTDSIHTREKWLIDAKGGISLDFFGIQNGKKISEKSKGSVTLSNNLLVIKMSNTQKYLVRGWYDGPNATIMILNGPWYEDGVPADVLSNPEQGSNLDKSWVRKK